MKIKWNCNEKVDGVVKFGFWGTLYTICSTIREVSLFVFECGRLAYERCVEALQFFGLVKLHSMLFDASDGKNRIVATSDRLLIRPVWHIAKSYLFIYSTKCCWFNYGTLIHFQQQKKIQEIWNSRWRTKWYGIFNRKIVNNRKIVWYKVCRCILMS